MNNSPTFRTRARLETLADLVIPDSAGRRWSPGSRTLTVLLAAAVTLAAAPVAAQSCTPTSITLSSQSDVDGFQSLHGPCDEVVGTLTVSGADITDLDGLSGLTSVHWVEINNNPLLTSIDGLSSVTTYGGPVFVQGNPILPNVDGLSGMTVLPGGALILSNNLLLSDLSGLSGLTSIAGSLAIDGNDSLLNLDSLSTLASVASNITIYGNDGLTSVSGLGGITGFTASLTIRNNPQLASLDGIPLSPGLAGLVIDNNDSLTDVDALSGLATVGNNYSSLLIDDNAQLGDLDGLSDLEGLDADLEITNNPMLDQCLALARLLDQTDDGLPGPGPGAASIPDISGDVIIFGNLDPCNSVSDILSPLVFSDGFELGTTAKWSDVLP